MTAIFGGPLAQAVGWALLHLLWQGVLVAAILAATLALLHKQSANARYLASCGALVIIVAMSLVTAIRAYDPIRVVSDPVPVAATQENIENVERAAVPTTSASVLPETTPNLETITLFAGSHMPQILLIWIAGVTLLSTRLVVGWLSAHRLAARYAQAADAQWQTAMRRIAEALQVKRTIQLLESAAVEVPTVVGWLRPVVLLPIATLSGLSAEQIEMILAHELAHIRRHDFIVNLMQSTVETLFFYQPAVWWISRRIRIEREHCCDDLAVSVTGDALRYARALTRFEELRIDAAQTVLAANGGSLVSRIRRLVGVDGEAAGWSSRWTAGAALLTVVVALMVGPALPMFAKHEPQTPPTPPAAPPATVEKAKPNCDAKSEIEVKASMKDVDDEDSADMETDDPADEADDSEEPAITVNPVPVVNVAPMIAPAIAAAIAPRVAFAQAPRAPRQRGDHVIDEKHLTVDDLITLRSAGVTPQYIESIRGAGLGELTLNDIVALRVQGVSVEYLRGLRDAGIIVNSADTAVSLRVQGVSGDYIKGMRAAGYDKLSAEDLINMRVMGVSPRYVQEMASAGYKSLSARELIELRSQGVSAEFVKSLAEAGYANLSVRDLVRLAASGVNAEFIRELAKYRSKQ